jgi:DNA-binding SARP family transcriptional activator
MMARATVRRLCALAVLAAVVAAPLPLLATTCNVPRQVAAILASISGSGTESLCGTTSPVGSLIGFLVLSVWVYLVLVAVLRAFAVLGTRVRIAGSTRLLVLTNRFLGGGWVRRLVDVTIGIGMVTASGHLIPPPGTRPPALPPAVAPTRQASLGERVTELLGLDDLAGPVATSGAGQERLYVVQAGDTLALIAERELGNADLWAWLFELNEGRLMPDGQRLEWPDELHAGWVLILPPVDLVGGPPTSAPQEAPPTTTPSASPSPAVPTTTSPQPGRHPVSVELPSGSVVAFSLWLAMSTAMLVALLRRRRSGMPSPPEPGICRYQPEAASVAEQLGVRARAATQRDESETTAADDTSRGTRDIPAQEQLAVPPLEDLTSEDPARVPVGERDGETVDLDLAGLGGLVLQGPDAVRVARAAVVTMLARRGPMAAELLVVGDLLPGVPEFPGLRRLPDLPAGLSLLEAEVIHRRRLLEGEELDNFAAYRRGHPDDPLPALVLLTDQVPLREAGRLEALMDQGRRLGIGAVALGGDLHQTATIELDADGRVAGATPAVLEARLLGARMFALSAPEAADLLGTLARSRADAPGFPEPQEPKPEPFLPPAASKKPPLRVRVLGSYRVETSGGEELRAGVRRKALELLAFYLLHPDGATQEQAVGSLWPEVPLGREAQWFWNALGNLRTAARRATGDRRLDVIRRDGDRYRPDLDAFDVDLWRFESCLADAKRAADAHDADAESGALTGTADAYGGELLEGSPDAWVTIPREDLRRRAVDVFARLAQLREATGDDEGAVAALDKGIAADPFAEELYRRAMRLQARLGRVDDVRRTFKELERRLADIDADPDPATQALVAELLRPPPRPH